MKSTCCLAVFYLFYRLFLSRDTFHRFNRMALLSGIAFSVTIPFVRFTTEEPTLVQRAMFDMEQLLQMADAPVGETEAGDFPLGLMVLFAVYIGGCLFFTGRFLYSVWQIVRLIHAGEVTVLEDGTRLVVTERTNPPFSWMKYVVISRIDMEESGAEILAHERAHIKACHSLDLWLAGCCTVLHWFNPAAWLLKQELQNVHEYEADEQVIAHGVDARHYQLLLIKKAVGSQRFTSMANSFNHSKLKNRITMMLKQKSNPWARLKFLYVLPLAAVTVVAFARPEISRQLEMIADVELPESLVYQQDKKSADQKLTEQKPADKKPARKDKPKIEMAVNLEPHGEVVVVGHGSTKLQDGKVFDIVRRDTLFPRTLDFQSNKRHSSIPSIRYAKPDPLVIIDGVECAGDLSQVNTNEIKSITVMKDENAIKAYGQKANGGVILITTKKVSSQIK